MPLTRSPPEGRTSAVPGRRYRPQPLRCSRISEGAAACAAEAEAEEAENPGFRDPQKVIVGRDPKEKPQGLVDMLPDWVGYSGLYVITLVPVFILGTTIAILFFSSLK